MIRRCITALYYHLHFSEMAVFMQFSFLFISLSSEGSEDGQTSSKRGGMSYYLLETCK